MQTLGVFPLLSTRTSHPNKRPGQFCVHWGQREGKGERLGWRTGYWIWVGRSIFSVSLCPQGPISPLPHKEDWAEVLEDLFSRPQLKKSENEGAWAMDANMQRAWPAIWVLDISSLQKQMCLSPVRGGQLSQYGLLDKVSNGLWSGLKNHTQIFNQEPDPHVLSFGQFLFIQVYW